MLKGVGSSSSTNITLDPQGLLKVGKQFYQIKPVATNDAETLERTLKHIQGTTLHKTKQVQAKLDVAREEQTILAKAVSIFDEMLQLLSNSRRFS
jgi:predicted ATP-grasp superfamily ATP-dependent carboligase